MVLNSSVVRKILAVAIASSAVAVAAIAPADAASAAPRAAVRVHVTSTGGVSAPAKLRPGVLQIRNTGGAEIMLVRATRFGVARLVHDLGAAGPGPLLRDFVLIDAMFPHRSAYVRLARGTHYLINVSASTITAAQVHTTVVSGGMVVAALPTAASISVSSDRVLHAARQASSPGWLRLHNGTAQAWLIGMARVRATTSDTALHHFLTHPSIAGLVTVAGPWAFLGLPGPHRNAWVSFGGRAGRWIVFSIAASARTIPRFSAATVALINVSSR